MPAAERIAVHVLLRIMEAVFIITALCLVAAGIGKCEKTVEGMRCKSRDQLSIDMWDDTNQNEKLKGQYYIFLSSIVLAFLTLVNTVMLITKHHKAMPVGIAITVTGIVLSILNGCIETWYTTGYGSAQYGNTVYYETWAAATALYFASAVAYSVDFAVARGLL